MEYVIVCAAAAVVGAGIWLPARTRRPWRLARWVATGLVVIATIYALWVVYELRDLGAGLANGLSHIQVH
jgi:hypothetical protein